MGNMKRITQLIFGMLIIIPCIVIVAICLAGWNRPPITDAAQLVLIGEQWRDHQRIPYSDQLTLESPVPILLFRGVSPWILAHSHLFRIGHWGLIVLISLIGGFWLGRSGIRVAWCAGLWIALAMLIMSELPGGYGAFLAGLPIVIAWALAGKEGRINAFAAGFCMLVALGCSPLAGAMLIVCPLRWLTRNRRSLGAYGLGLLAGLIVLAGICQITGLNSGLLSFLPAMLYQSFIWPISASATGLIATNIYNFLYMGIWGGWMLLSDNFLIALALPIAAYFMSVLIPQSGLPAALSEERADWALLVVLVVIRIAAPGYVPGLDLWLAILLIKLGTIGFAGDQSTSLEGPRLFAAGLSLYVLLLAFRIPVNILQMSDSLARSPGWDRVRGVSQVAAVSFKPTDHVLLLDHLSGIGFSLAAHGIRLVTAVSDDALLAHSGDTPGLAGLEKRFKSEFNAQKPEWIIVTDDYRVWTQNRPIPWYFEVAGHNPHYVQVLARGGCRIFRLKS